MAILTSQAQVDEIEAAFAVYKQLPRRWYIHDAWGSFYVFDVFAEASAKMQELAEEGEDGLVMAYLTLDEIDKSGYVRGIKFDNPWGKAAIV